jgi:arginase
MENHVLLTPYFFERFSPGLQELLQPGWENNRASLPEGTIQQQVEPLYQKIADFTAMTALKGNRPVSIAGDCCAAIPVMAGLRRAGIKPVLIWLDAHGDFNTWETTPSGFLGGMPLAMLVGRGDQTLLEMVKLQPISESDVILFDGRDLDPGERLALRSSEVLHLQAAGSLPEHPRLQDHPIYVHFDTDIVDPAEMPAMNYPSVGGPGAAETSLMFRKLAQTGKIVAVSVSTWNPELAGSDLSRDLSMNLLEDFLS